MNTVPESLGSIQQSYRRCLKYSISLLLLESGFEFAENLALETICELTQSFLCELGRSAHHYTEIAGRSSPLAADVLLALADMGADTLQTIKDYAFRKNRRSLPSPLQSQASRVPSILHTGDKRRPRRHIILENFPEMPDSHSYIYTPTHLQPDTDYRSVREKSSLQKWDVERALSRFIARTGATESLFGNEDEIMNPYPLIASHWRRGPIYLDALLFSDQIFEEDERDFLAKKRIKNETEQDLNAEQDVTKPSKAAIDREDLIDNPFLRPAKISQKSTF